MQLVAEADKVLDQHPTKNAVQEWLMIASKTGEAFKGLADMVRMRAMIRGIL
jgi:hypothetical protein